MIKHRLYQLKQATGGLAVALSLLLLAACTAATGTSEVPPETQMEATGTPLPPLGATLSPDRSISETDTGGSEAEISNVNILLLESFPVQVQVTIQGMLPDGCTSIERIDQARDNNTFVLTVATLRDIAALCVAQRQPFEETVSLDVVGLPAGNYTVTVTGSNTISSSFELSADNILSPEPPVPSGEASISGIVWEDACQLSQDGTPSAGCIEAEQGGYRADGIFDSNEARFAGIAVSLAPGECPGGEVIATAITDEGGSYTFGEIEPGLYCIFIDPLTESNASSLLPGGWTYPALEVGSLTVAAGAGQIQTADFGWDPQFDAPEPGPETVCQDQATYVADITIPDDTILGPGEPFVKTWRIRNDGNCTWDSGYKLIFASGEQMGAPTGVPLAQEVEPGTEADLSIPLLAPLSPGTYRGDWFLQDEAGELFGSQGEFPFYVQIVVEGGAGDIPDPTSPPEGSTGLTITGLVWEDRCSILSDGSPSAECTENEVGGYRANGILDEGEQAIANVQVKLSAGECPGSQVMFATINTDANGLYRFSGLQAGPHCISIDAAAEPNASVLLPGDWTYPAPGKGWTTVDIGANETQNIDFGWNYYLR